MPAPWQNSLPLEEYVMTRVVIYYYKGRWVPVKFCRLAEAIKLHYKAKEEGKEFFIFPADFVPEDF